VALKKSLLCSGGSQKSQFSLLDVQSDVLLPSCMHVMDFSTDLQSTEEIL